MIAMWAAVEFGLRRNVRRRLVSWVNRGRDLSDDITWYDRKHETPKTPKQWINSSVYNSLYELLEKLFWDRLEEVNADTEVKTEEGTNVQTRIRTNAKTGEQTNAESGGQSGEETKGKLNAQTEHGPNAIASTQKSKETKTRKEPEVIKTKTDSKKPVTERAVADTRAEESLAGPSAEARVFNEDFAFKRKSSSLSEMLTGLPYVSERTPPIDEEAGPTLPRSLTSSRRSWSSQEVAEDQNAASGKAPRSPSASHHAASVTETESTGESESTAEPESESAAESADTVGRSKLAKQVFQW